MLLERLSPDELGEVSAIVESAGKQGFNVLKKIYELTRTQTDTGVRRELMQYARENPFVFRGNNQDMSWFWSRRELPLEKLTELQEPLREQVLRNFGALQRQGLVVSDGQRLTLTAEGNRYIHDVGYISEAVKADQELNRHIQGVLGNAAGAQRFRPAGDAALRAAGRTAAKTGAKAVETGAKAAGTAAGAAASAGVTLAAQVAQEAVTGLNKAVNTLLTHK